MKNIIVVIILIAAAYGVYAYAVPAINEVSVHRAEISQVEEIEADVQSILESRDEVLERYKSARQKQEAFERLAKLVPPESDREDIYLFFQKIVTDAGIQFKGVTLSDGGDKDSPAGQKAISFDMEVEGSYDKMRLLLDTLENNLRVMDVYGLNFSQNDEGEFILGVKGQLYYGN